MSGISGISNDLINSLIVQGNQSRTDPAEKFKELDTDGNSNLDTTELSTLAQELSKMTGKTLSVDDAISTYDTNGDGMLSQDEMNSMIQQVLGPPPSSGGDFASQQAIQAYQSNSGNDSMSLLLNLLNGNSDSSTSSSTSDSDQISNLLSLLNGTSDSSTSSSGSVSDQIYNLLSALSQTSSTNSSQDMSPEAHDAKLFSNLDSNSSGTLNETELSDMADKISTITGKTVDASSLISTYDSDGDGELSKSEFTDMMKSLHEQMGPPPPPPPEMAGTDGSDTSTDTSTQATTNASNNDQLALLRQLLSQYAVNLSTDS